MKNYVKLVLKASSRSVGLVQIAALLISVVGAFVVDWTANWIMIGLLFYYAYSALGVSMMMHRYWTHKTFNFKYAPVKWFFTLIAVLAGRGSPIAWVYVHRLHHAYSDTPDDPHSPKYVGFKFIGLRASGAADKIKIFMIKDLLTKPNIFINEYYIGFILIWTVILASIDFKFLYFMWALPVCINQISQDLFNYYAHITGYRNTDTKDDSTNVIWLWPLILGEAWHNNHHAAPAAANFKVRSWEMDPVNILIKIINNK